MKKEMTLEKISQHMLDFIGLYCCPPNNGEIYTDTGFCGGALWHQIKIYWEHNFNNNADFEYVVSGRWKDDNFDLDGGNNDIFDTSGVIGLLFDYAHNVLGWDLDKYCSLIQNNNNLTEGLVEYFECLNSNKTIIKESDFEMLEFENLAQSLFHVESKDIDDETGAKLEEVILVQFLSSYPKLLAHKPLKYWVDTYCGTC